MDSQARSLVNPTSPNSGKDPIAIVAVAAVSPIGNGAETFWRNTCGKADGIIEVPRSRWNHDLYYDPDRKAPNKTYSRLGGFVLDDGFDRRDLGVNPMDARAMDIVIRMALAAAYELFSQSGYLKRDFDRSRCAVILGNAKGGVGVRDNTIRQVYFHAAYDALRRNEHFRRLAPDLQEAILGTWPKEALAGCTPVHDGSMTGWLGNVVAGQIARYLDLSGPSFTTHAACASAVAALACAVDGLQRGEFDLAVSGGASSCMSPAVFVEFSKINALSPDGSRPFDVTRNGFVMAEGAALLLLKRYHDAVRDGDRIIAVIRGIGAASDGRSKSPTAPRETGQILAIRRALQAAGCERSGIGLVEAHGTATPVGDRTEVRSLQRVLGHPASDLPIHLTSGKSQIGHTLGAAGAFGVLRAALAIETGTIPPSIHCERPDPVITPPFQVATEPIPWKGKGPRRALVNSFGFGGTDFSVVLEEPGPSGTHVTVRADLQQSKGNDSTPAPERGSTMNAALRPHGSRLAFLFPGQGSQYVGMGKPLYDRYAIVRETFEEADDVLHKPLTKLIFEGPEEDLKDTKNLQPALITISVAYFRLLASLGIRPDLVAGHSLGEYAALVAAEVLDFADILKIVALRGEFMSLAPGKMAAIMAEEEKIVAVIETIPEVWIANRNSPRQFVISGSVAGIDLACKKLREAGVKRVYPLPVSAPFHCPLQQGFSDRFAEILEGYDFRPPTIPILTNVTGGFHSNDPAEIRRRMVEQCYSSVNWVANMETVEAFGVRTVVETGPGIVLCGLGNVIWDGRIETLAFQDNKRNIIFDELVEKLQWAVDPGMRHPETDTSGKGVTPGPKPARAIETTHTAEAPQRKTPTEGGRRENGGMEERNERFVSHLLEDDTLELANDFAFSAFARRHREMINGMIRHLYETERASRPQVVVTGVNLGLPGKARAVFGEENWKRLVQGENRIDPLDEETQRRILEKNIIRTLKSPTGGLPVDVPVRKLSEVIHLAGQLGEFDLRKDYGIEERLDETLDISFRLSLASTIEALRDACIPLIPHYETLANGKRRFTKFALPPEIGDRTSVWFGCAFPGLENILDEVSKMLAWRFTSLNQGVFEELERIYGELLDVVEDPAHRSQLYRWYAEAFSKLRAHTPKEAPVYRFNRKFLFRILGSMGASQIAQFIGARGLAIQSNNACASTAIAKSLGAMLIRQGEADCVIVTGSDAVTARQSIEYIGAGFLASGAATTEKIVERAAKPFDRDRNGMILGAGVGTVILEKESLPERRGVVPKALFIAGKMANSAFHATRLHPQHIAEVMQDLFRDLERDYGITPQEIARETVFVSHETYTPARGGSAQAEIRALRETFGPAANQVLITNTKGFTGHAMGAGIEDAASVEILDTGEVPPVANLENPDPELGDLRLSRGEKADPKYALRLAAGFGSQICITFEAAVPGPSGLRDEARHARFLAEVTGIEHPETEIVHRTYRVKLPPKDQAVLERMQRARAKEKPVTPAAATPGKPTATPTRESRGTPPAASPTTTTAGKPATPTLTETASPLSASDITERVLEEVCAFTGYERDEVDPKAHIEDDLGIDSNKAPELIDFIEEKLGVEIPNEVASRIETIEQIVEAVSQRGSIPTPQPTPDAAKGHAEPLSPISSPPAPDSAPKGDLVSRVIEAVCAFTGYERDEVDPKAHIEDDLGIDSNKAPELIDFIEEKLGVEIPNEVASRIETIEQIVEAVAKNGNLPGAFRHLLPAEKETPTETRAPNSEAASIAERVIEAVCAFTGYERDEVDPKAHIEDDLGIDSNKAPELIDFIEEQLGVEIPNEAASAIQTIEEIVETIESGREKREPAPPAARAGDESAPPQAPPSPPSGDRGTLEAAQTPPPTAEASYGEILEAVIRHVCAFTGYERDEVDPKAHIEDDLGIDSNKAPELIDYIEAQMGVEISNEEATELERIEEIARIVFEKRSASPRVDQSQPAASPPAETTHEARLERRIVTWQEIEGEGSDAAFRQISDLPIALVGALSALTPFLEEAHVIPFDFEQPDEAWRERVAATGPFAGLCYLHGASAQRVHTEHLARLATLIAELPMRKGAFLLALTPEQRNDDPEFEAVCGLFASIQHERSEAVVVRIASGISLDDPLRTVAERVLRAPGGMEIRFSQDRILTPIVTSAPPLGPCLDLTPSDTVLLTGGARGITAGISKEIARRHHCRIALIGRTPLPQDLPEHLHDLHPRMSQEELRAKIRERLKERGASVRPTDVAREIERMRASHEAAENIGAISEAGAEVVYFPCDITDRNALARTIEEIDARFGRITGIVHGAGIKWDAPLEKLTPRHWEAVFAPKVGAVESLSALIDPDSLRFFVVLSSIAALYGNATQGNYAAANRAVVALMRNLHEAHGVLAKAIYCPPISGVGMAADPGILRHLAQLGIDYGTPEALAAFVAEEIAVADPEVAVAWHGRVGALARYFAQAPSGGDPGRSGGGNGTRQPTPLSPAEGSDSFFDRVLEHQPNERIVLEKTFDVERDITLLDHAIEGTPVVPAIRGIEVFLAAASRLFPGKRIESLKDLRFLKWLKLEGGKPLTVRVKAEGTPEACKVYIEQEIRSPRGAQPGSYRIHFSGTVVFADQTSAASGLFSLEGLEEAGVSPKEIYRPDRFFHGPEFQVLGGVSRWGIEGAEGEYAPPKTIPGGNHLPRGIHPEHFLVLEALEQLAGIFDMRFHGTFALPAAFSQLRFIAAPVGPIRLRVMEVGGGAKERRFDLLALDRANRPVVSARGFTLKVIRTLVPSARFPEDTPPVPPVPGSSSMINSPLPGDGGNTQMAIAEVPLDRLEAAIRENPALIEAFLGEEEMEALLAMRHRRRRLERIGGTIAAKKAFLRYCARIEGRTPALTSLTLRHRKSGKPYLCVDGDPYPVALSIAHSGKRAVALVGRKTAGIDLVDLSSFGSEAFKRRVYTLRERILASSIAKAAEIEHFFQAGAPHQLTSPLPESALIDEDTALAQIWAAKESFVKALGTGFRGLDFRQIEVKEIRPDGRVLLDFHRNTLPPYLTRVTKKEGYVQATTLFG